MHGFDPSLDVVRLENQGDSFCPYRMKSMWRFADGDLNALVYDVSMQVVCLHDECSVANCGHRAKCVIGGEETQLASNATLTDDDTEKKAAAKKAKKARCKCQEGFYGNPYERCFPTDSEAASSCNCHRLLFSTQNAVALAKHHNR